MAKEKKTEGASKVGKTSKKASRNGETSKEQKNRAAASAFSLLADDKTVDPTLSSLFAVKQPPVKAAPVVVDAQNSTAKIRQSEPEDENDAELSELDEEIDEDHELGSEESEQDDGEHKMLSVVEDDIEEDAQPKRKRKRKDGGDELEDVYMSRLAREGEKEDARLAAERVAKRQKQAVEQDTIAGADEDDSEVDGLNAAVESDDEDEGPEEALSPPPKHETEIQADQDVEKANRTVFLGNVSTDAITSKTSLKALKAHLSSFFTALKEPSTSHKLESIRFRSTPYASAIPKKAAYAKKELMDATSKSTNAYAVYSTPLLAREAAKRLNGSIVLNRHLRVDEVAHPAKVDHHRCIFVGNLGFVDDESNIQDANEADGREVRKRGKEPADVEEGLWRTFNKCGAVESVRVIRDSTTRVGKGIAYVQFADANAVEAALLYNEKKFPPMLPRKLRVSRAKAPKRNAKPGSGRPAVAKQQTTGARSNGGGYQRKLTSQEASRLGRTGKLLGRAAAAQVRRSDSTRAPPAPRVPGVGKVGSEIKTPESFVVFEGHRATSRQGKSGLKLGGKHSKSKAAGSKVTKRSAFYKAKAKKKT